MKTPLRHQNLEAKNKIEINKLWQPAARYYEAQAEKMTVATRGMILLTCFFKLKKLVLQYVQISDE